MPKFLNSLQSSYWYLGKIWKEYLAQKEKNFQLGKKETKGDFLFVRLKEIDPNLVKSTKGKVINQEHEKLLEKLCKIRFKIHDFHIYGHVKFACPLCSQPHVLDTRYNYIPHKSKNLWRLVIKYEESICPFLFRYEEGITYDLFDKKIEEVIESKFDKKIIQEKLPYVKNDYLIEQRRKFIRKRLKEKGVDRSTKNPQEYQLGTNIDNHLDLLLELTCDFCEKGFSEEDIQKKNYYLSYGCLQVLTQDIGCLPVQQISDVVHQNCLETSPSQRAQDIRRSLKLWEKVLKSKKLNN